MLKFAKKMFIAMMVLLVVTVCVIDEVAAFDLERPAYTFDFMIPVQELTWDMETATEIAKYYCDDEESFRITQVSGSRYGFSMCVVVDMNYPLEERLEENSPEDAKYTEIWGPIEEPESKEQCVGLMYYDYVNHLQGRRILFITGVPQLI